MKNTLIIIGLLISLLASYSCSVAITCKMAKTPTVVVGGNTVVCP